MLLISYSLFSAFTNGTIKNDTVSISGTPIKASSIINSILKVTKSKSKVIFKPGETGQPQKYVKDENQLMCATPFEQTLEELLK